MYHWFVDDVKCSFIKGGSSSSSGIISGTVNNA